LQKFCHNSFRRQGIENSMDGDRGIFITYYLATPYIKENISGSTGDISLEFYKIDYDY
jgi:hypothetical protein